MNIFELDNGNIQKVAVFMANIKPEFWDIEGAEEQLHSGIGWFLEDNLGRLKGWILCKALECYKTLEIECLGYDADGVYRIGPGLQPLVEQAESWAKEKQFSVMRFTIGSRGLSCHQRELKELWEELRDIKAFDREEFDWFLSMGYVPAGVMPNIYGDKYHGIILVKSL